MPWISWMATLGTAAVMLSAMDAVPLRPCESEATTEIDLAPVLVPLLTVAVKENVPLPLSANGCAALPPIDDRSPLTAIPVLTGCAPGVTVTVSVVGSPADTDEGVAEWTDHVLALGQGQLMNEISSWMTGVNRNVEGKQRPRIMRYSGGHPAYREHCDAVAADGYRQLALA